MNAFAELGLGVPLLRVLEEREHFTPTPVQSKAIPAVLRGRDVWAQAQTGSGKTAAFALPILQNFAEPQASSPRGVLILVPTRELAAQVGSTIKEYARHLPKSLKIVTVYGGVSINPQMMKLRGRADVVVATPGRLLDLVEKNAFNLSTVSLLVLDEADRLLDLGFSDELGRILEMLPRQRQNLLFSATFPDAVTTLAEAILSDPVRIEIEDSTESAPDILERAIEVDVPRRTQLLVNLIKSNGWSRVLVFVATKYATEHIADKLRRAGIEAGALNGELSQGARTRALADFQSSKIQVLVATDLAARGIDVVQLPAVVNYDLPRSAVDYTHRIGRTARAGETGVAVSFVSAETHAHFRLIEKRNQRQIPREQIEGFEPVETDIPKPEGTGGVKGKRKSKKDKLREAAARSANPSAPPAKPLDPSFRWHRADSNPRGRK